MDVRRFSEPIDLKSVTISDPFWRQEMELVRREVIPYQWEALNDRVPGASPSYAMHNFRAAARLMKRKREQGASFAAPVWRDRGFNMLPEDPESPDPDTFYGFVFQDSDFSKWIEAVGYSLAQHPDPALEALADGAIDVVCAAQDDTGYLDTCYILNGMDRAFTNLKDHHELYCLGHLTEAAVSYYQATGKDSLLKAACRFADYVATLFGPGEGQIKGYPGHEVAEMALFKLYGVTGDKKYRDLACFFLDERGASPNYFDLEEEENARRRGAAASHSDKSYYQAHKPVRDMDEITGHAVRAMYLYAGMAEEARLTGDEEMAAAAQRLWESVTRRQMYITGAVGASAYGESFTYDYDLPNGLVYGETCASVGLAFFAERMLRLHPRAEYADVLEKVLYNGAISGMSLSGTEFFYVNPLEAEPKRDALVEAFRHVKTRRQPWFSCACCPPNLARLLTSLGNYLWMTREDRLYVHLYAAAEGRVTAASGTARVAVRSGYPWDGRISVKTEVEEGEVTLALRVPGWCAAWEVSLDGHPVEASLEEGYLVLPALMTGEHEAVLDLAMPAKAMTADRRIRADHGKLAVQKGPIVFCLEEADNGPDLYELAMSPDAPFYVETCKGELAGMIRVRVPGYRVYDDVPKREAPALYHPAGALRREPFTLTFIPYCAWANREEGEMRVFVNRL